MQAPKRSRCGRVEVQRVEVQREVPLAVKAKSRWAPPLRAEVLRAEVV